MIILSEKFQDICSKILPAVDTNETSTLSTTLELVTKDKVLYVNVTNREYYVQVKLQLDEDIDFHATVNANLFLKLISQITTDTIELSVDDTNIKIKGNGNYKLPLIYDNDKLLELPTIDIINTTNTFNIKSDILKSILQFNSKELTKGVASKPVQKLYYVDECGAITFTSGACVNNFTLEAPVKLLFNNRLVKLFKLFDTENVKFSLGYDAISEDIIQTKVRFETDSIAIIAILSCDDTLLKSVPVAAIRSRADIENYPYSKAPKQTKRHQSPNDYGPRVIVLGIVDTKTGEIIGFNGEFIHGTNKPESIGKNESKGCARMNNDEVKELAAKLEIGQYILIKE